MKDDFNIFKESTKSKESVRKGKKAITLKDEIILLNGCQKVLNAFESEIFPKEKQGKGLESILDCVDCVAKVFDCKVYDRK